MAHRTRDGHGVDVGRGDIDAVEYEIVGRIGVVPREIERAAAVHDQTVRRAVDRAAKDVGALVRGLERVIGVIDVVSVCTDEDYARVQLGDRDVLVAIRIIDTLALTALAALRLCLRVKQRQEEGGLLRTFAVIDEDTGRIVRTGILEAKTARRAVAGEDAVVDVPIIDRIIVRGGHYVLAGID